MPFFELTQLTEWNLSEAKYLRPEMKMQLIRLIRIRLKKSYPLFGITAYFMLIFTALFCLAALCGCGMGGYSKVKVNEGVPKDNNGNPINIRVQNGLSDGMAGQIRWDYFNNYMKGYFSTIDNVWIKGYYGTYNGSVVVIMNSYPGPMTTIDLIIDGIVFTYDATHPFLVWRDGQLYGLEKAYDIGFLAREDILDIVTGGRRYDYPGYLEGIHAGLVVYTEEYLIRQYFAYYFLGSEYLGYPTRNEIWIEEYYGTYNGCLAMMIDYNGSDYADDERIVDIAGIPFHYTNRNSIIVFARSGVMYAPYELQEAYDLSFLTQENLRDIADQHNRIFY